MGGGIVRHQADACAVLPSGVRISRLSQQHVGHEAVGVRVIGPHHQRSTKRLFRFLEPASYEQGVSQQVVRGDHLEIIRAQADVLSIMSDRLVVFPVSVQLETQRVMRVRTIDQSGAIVRERFIAVTLFSQDDPQLIVGPAVGMPGEDRPPDAGLALVLPVALQREPSERAGDPHEQHCGRRAMPPPAPAEPRGHQGVSPEYAEHDQRRKRQIHPALGADLGGNGNDAGRGRQRHEHPRRHQAQGRTFPPHEHGSHHDREDGDPVRKGRRRRHGNGRAVVEHQRSWPDGARQIRDHHARLIQEVRPWCDPARQSGAVRAWARQHQRDEDNPGRGECRVESASGPERAADGTGAERGIVQQHHHRRRDHRFLARHPERARDHCQRRPAHAW